MSGFRTIVVDNRTWKWRIGKTAVSAKAQDTGERKHISISELSGMTNHDVERAIWKGYFSITPKDIANWLRKFK